MRHDESKCEYCVRGVECPQVVNDEYAVLTDKLSQLMRGTADALKGDPGRLQMHDWSDLPATAKEARELLLEVLDLGPVACDCDINQSDSCLDAQYGHDCPAETLTILQQSIGRWVKRHTWGSDEG